jgi:hypothetical protein
VSAKAFGVLFELAHHCIEIDDGSDPLYTAVFRFLLSKLPELCEFIRSAAEFLDDRDGALALVVELSQQPVPETVFQLGLRVVDMLFERTTNSFLHKRLQNLFSKISQNPAQLRAFCAESRICRRIVDVFKTREDAPAAYWGVLYTIADVIAEKAEFDQDDEEWESFIETTVKEMKTLITEPFGGPRPSGDEPSVDSNEPFPVGRSQMQGGRPETVTTLRRDRGEEEDDLLD